MRKFFSLCLAAILSLAIVLIANASFNPFNDYFKSEASRLQEKGLMKNVFTVFDANKKQLKSDIAITYRDHTNTIKEASPDNEGRVFINYANPGYIQVIKVRINGIEYDVTGKESYKKFDMEDINEGEVDFKVIQYKTNNNVAFIYDAD